MITKLVPNLITLNPDQEATQSQELREKLEKRVVGQAPAITAIVNTMDRYNAGMSDPERPVGNFFFLGPTGTGKTELVESVSVAFGQTEGDLIKLDCAEYQHGHEIAKIIGSPPGYLGHRETSPIISHSRLAGITKGLPILLFDEIEKASDALWNLLLGVLDKGVITNGNNQRVDLRKSLIFLTSNVGARQLEAAAGPGLGFSPQTKSANIEGLSIAALKKKFTPEFFNRLDRRNIVTFSPLSEDSISQIIDIKIAGLQERVGVKLSLSPAARQFLVEEGFDPKYGGRPLVQALDAHVASPLARLKITNQLNGIHEVFVGKKDNGLTFQAYVNQAEKKAA